MLGRRKMNLLSTANQKYYRFVVAILGFVVVAAAIALIVKVGTSANSSQQVFLRKLTFEDDVEPLFKQVQSSQLDSSNFCPIEKLDFPVRSVVIQFDPPYKMLVHKEGVDLIVSDSIVQSNGTSNFERWLQITMASRLPRDFPPQEVVILDIGANIGLHSLYFASLGYEVHAFEPLQANFNILQCSKVANDFKNLKTNNFGLSKAASVACMDVNPTNHGGSTIISVDDVSQCKDDFVELRTLDEYAEKNLAQKYPYLAKVDVEGFELAVEHIMLL
eukprot:TRINITY_DN2332_c0_g1_i6.p1 TRINITY_DN2332_c0_g1~~TRINITY_DN2332_c0_g1_i6.p1  ORF type:complete len:275 (-),score=22.45 TRINITY_DN2332_c0_g1_i6:76-900(-)